MTNATAGKINKIRKSIELQRRVRKNIEASRIDGIPVDLLDVERMLATTDEIIDMLENRIDAIERRAAVSVATT